MKISNDTNESNTMSKTPANPYAKKGQAALPPDKQDTQTELREARKDQILDPLIQTTRGSVKSAIELFDSFQRQRNEPILSALTADDVIDSQDDLLLLDEDDRGKMFLLLGNFAFWLHENPPTKAGSSIILSAASIGQYFCSVKGELARRFPKAFAFDNVEDDWYSPMRKLFVAKLLRREMTSGNDVALIKCHGLYREHNHSLDRQRDSVQGANDLKSVNRKLLQSGQANASSKALLQTLAYSAAGRGGEVKFQHYDDWFWDTCLDILETSWKETKTLKTHIMTFCSDKACGCAMCLFFLHFSMYLRMGFTGLCLQE